MQIKHYSLKYRNAKGEVKQYQITRPIEEDAAGFVCYSSGKGIRHFLHSNVIEIDSEYPVRSKSVKVSKNGREVIVNINLI